MTSCNNNASVNNEKPIVAKQLQEKDIAKEVFQTLQLLDTLSIRSYQKHLLSFNDIQVLVADTNYKIGSYYRKDLKRITEKEFNSITANDLQNLKSLGKQFHINWAKIKFAKYLANPQEIEGGTVLLHETHFSDTNNKNYFIKTAALFDGKAYYILKLAEVEEVRDSKFHPLY
jgi:NhaP-type Na+/H+ and K+/H+ antiporter